MRRGRHSRAENRERPSARRAAAGEEDGRGRRDRSCQISIQPFAYRGRCAARSCQKSCQPFVSEIVSASVAVYCSELLECVNTATTASLTSPPRSLYEGAEEGLGDYWQPKSIESTPETSGSTPGDLESQSGCKTDAPPYEKHGGEPKANRYALEALPSAQGRGEFTPPRCEKRTGKFHCAKFPAEVRKRVPRTQPPQHLRGSTRRSRTKAPKRASGTNGGRVRRNRCPEMSGPTPRDLESQRGCKRGAPPYEKHGGSSNRAGPERRHRTGLQGTNNSQVRPNRRPKCQNQQQGTKGVEVAAKRSLSRMKTRGRSKGRPLRSGSAAQRIKTG